MPKVAHLIDSVALGGAQRVVKTLFESRPVDNDLTLYAVRSVTGPIQIIHKGITEYTSSRRLSWRPLWELIHLLKKRNIEGVNCHL